MESGCATELLRQLNDVPIFCRDSRVVCDYLKVFVRQKCITRRVLSLARPLQTEESVIKDFLSVEVITKVLILKVLSLLLYPPFVMVL